MVEVFNQYRNFFEIIIVWIISFIFVGLSSCSTGNARSFWAYSTYVYFIFVSFGMIGFIHKISVIKRLGIQNLRYFTLGLTIIISIGARYLLGIANPDSLTSLVIAPLSEEIFFRGYLLGNFKTQNSSTKRIYGSIVIISILFTISHILKPDAGLFGLIFKIPCLALLCGISYWLLGTIVPSISIRTAWNFFASTKRETHFSNDFWLWIVLIFLPNIILIIEYFWQKRKSINVNVDI